jgi:predicted DNA-binding ribbon-helix-helix protein
MRGTLIKRSLKIGDRRTSFALEPEFWAALEALSRGRGQSLPRLIGTILATSAGRPAASALRVYLLKNAALLGNVR